MLNTTTSALRSSYANQQKLQPDQTGHWLQLNHQLRLHRVGVGCSYSHSKKQNILNWYTTVTLFRHCHIQTIRDCRVPDWFVCFGFGARSVSDGSIGCSGSVIEVNMFKGLTLGQAALTWLSLYSLHDVSSFLVGSERRKRALVAVLIHKSIASQHRFEVLFCLYQMYGREFRMRGISMK